jgi:asparagine synthase (glutamine-hydrolysing)
MAMAASLELRVPLLDHVVAEFATRLPSSRKLRRLERKVLLRRVARDLLPPEILDRKKEGFPVPFAEWFRNEAREMVEDLLSPSALQPRGIFDPAYVSRLVQDHQSRRADHSALLWGLMGLELWLRRFVDGGGRLVDAERDRHAV